MNLLPDTNELEKLGISREELLKKFAEQLRKEFEANNTAGYLPEISHWNYKEVHEALRQALEHVTQAGNLQQLLYRIDIKESDYLKTLGVDSDENLADIVIRRVLQKVILKIIYSK